MMRLRAVRSLLVGEVASLRVGEREDAAAVVAAEREALARARRRALLITVLAALALAVLFVFREPGRDFLPMGRGEETVFTLGVVFIAAFAGFRLAQYHQLRIVERVWEDLLERDGEAD